jgi:FAD binding domain
VTREISRQAFVRGTFGAVAAGVLLGARQQTAPAAKNPSTSVSHRPAAGPDPQDWNAFDAAIDGRVILPSSAEYATAKGVFNKRFDDSTPAAVVVATSTEDVQKAVEFAAQSGVKVSARSGGHSYIGASTAGGTMVIDLRGMSDAVTYDDDRGLVTVSAAADLDSIQTALAAHGRRSPAAAARPSVSRV